jgi:hypothetical protein
MEIESHPQLSSSALLRLQPAVEKYRHLLNRETYRRYRNGILPSSLLFLLQAPDLAQTIADIAKEQETSYVEQP